MSPIEFNRRIEAIPEVKSATVELVWEPTWSRDMMSDVAILHGNGVPDYAPSSAKPWDCKTSGNQCVGAFRRLFA